jgi:hypothetical protein
MMSWRIPVEAEILDALRVRQRPGLYIARVPLRGGYLTVLESIRSGAADDEVIIGLALYDDDDGWYLGCMACCQPIGEAAAGMCVNCRRGGGG